MNVLGAPVIINALMPRDAVLVRNEPIRELTVERDDYSQ
jgi:hypothetical protein